MRSRLLRTGYRQVTARLPRLNSTMATVAVSRLADGRYPVAAPPASRPHHTTTHHEPTA
jgi:hypothetical protein